MIDYILLSLSLFLSLLEFLLGRAQYLLEEIFGKDAGVKGETLRTCSSSKLAKLLCRKPDEEFVFLLRGTRVDKRGGRRQRRAKPL